MSSEDEFDKFLPLAAAIAAIKVKLLDSLLDEYVKRLEAGRKRNLNYQERGALENTLRELVANLPPSVFKMSPDWKPTSEAEVLAKLAEMKNDSEFQAALKTLLVERMPEE